MAQRMIPNFASLQIGIVTPNSRRHSRRFIFRRVAIIAYFRRGRNDGLDDGLSDGLVLNSRRSSSSQSMTARWSARSTSTMSRGSAPVNLRQVLMAASGLVARIVSNLGIFDLRDVNSQLKSHGRLAAPASVPGKFKNPVGAGWAHDSPPDQPTRPLAAPGATAPVWVRWLRWRASGIDGTNWASSTSKTRIPGLQVLGSTPAGGTGGGQ